MDKQSIMGKTEHYVSVHFTIECLDAFRSHVFSISKHPTGLGLYDEDAYLTTARRFKRQPVAENNPITRS